MPTRTEIAIGVWLDEDELSESFVRASGPGGQNVNKLSTAVELRLDAPVGEVLPARGYDKGSNTFTAPPADGSKVTVAVSPTSDRLQLLDPFPAWDGKDYLGLPVLMKAQGKCTTDHISAAGKWLTYRGHLENISGNLFIGAVNAHNDAVGEGLDITDGQRRSFPDIAKRYSEAGIRWCAIAALFASPIS